jgi:hypothetical protein
MANVKVYSQSNVAGNPSIWRPKPNNIPKNIKVKELGAEAVCDGVNDFRTTYMVKRVWDAQLGVMTAPVYVTCNYVE